MRSSTLKALITASFLILFLTLLYIGLLFTDQKPSHVWVIVLTAVLIVIYIYTKLSMIETRTKG